jgi:hypothetical protein
MKEQAEDQSTERRKIGCESGGDDGTLSIGFPIHYPGYQTTGTTALTAQAAVNTVP